ncbi:MFS general substrate transporter [Sistotremastrum suecicum HHB10207 ss-3]|uniref:MFS general substrate transporter n=1 Tax=Sistotremastrum suecicum HHB10207 ss-3 TaxID=1314776 RepID=A0A166AU25_9AGAM|nr:MFS general substrate transporter [Sistotremastrum suecicum HHB10207 ss-3]
MMISSRSEKSKAGEEVETSAVYTDTATRAWMTVVGAFLVQFVTLGQTNMWGVWEDYYKRHYLSHRSSGTIGWIGGTELALLLTLGLICGPLMDRGYFRQLIYAAAALGIFSNFMLSLAKPNQYYQIFLTQALGMGTSMGLSWSISMAVTAAHFKRHRAWAMGLVSTGGGLSGTVIPIMMNRLFYSIGFGSAMRAHAGMNAALWISAALLMSMPRELQKKQASSRVKIHEVLVPFLRDGPYMMVTVGTILLAFGVGFHVGFIQLFSITKGFSSSFSFYTIAILNGSSILGRLFPNYFADRFGVILTVIPFTFAMSITMLSFLAAHTPVGFALVCATYGFSFGAFFGLLPTVLASLARSPSEVGARVGISSASWAVPIVTAPSITGALLGQNYNWTKPLILFGVLDAAGACCYVVAWLLLRRRNLKRVNSEMPSIQSIEKATVSSTSSSVKMSE